jgi:RND family efflux transporter MFP subunit
MHNSPVSRRPKSLGLAILIIVPFVAVVLLMRAAGSGQVPPAPTQAKIHPVTIAQVILQPSYVQQHLAYGRVEASVRSQIGFELSGKVVQILVEEGQQVNQGTPLAKLDTLRLESSMRELDASLSQAEADLRLANQSLKRVKELVAKKLDSKQRLDDITEAAASAQSRVTQAQARKATLQVELDKSVLYADQEYVIVEQPIDVGTVVSAGQPIFTVRNLRGLQARIGMAQKLADNFIQGQSYPLVYEGQTLQGKVVSVAQQRALATRTLDVLFSLEHQRSLGVVPGDLIGIQHQERVDQAGAWVPRSALTSGIRGLWTLFVVKGSGQQVLSSKSVEILYAESDRVFIRGALNADDWLVVNGGHRLVPSQLVDANVSEDVD